MNQDDFAITIEAPLDSPSAVHVAIDHSVGYGSTTYSSTYNDLSNVYANHSTPVSPYPPRLQLSHLRESSQDQSFSPASPADPLPFAGQLCSTPVSPSPSSPSSLSAVSHSFQGINLNESSTHSTEYWHQAFNDNSYSPQPSLILANIMYHQANNNQFELQVARDRSPTPLPPLDIPSPTYSTYTSPSQSSGDRDLDFLSSIVNIELFDDGPTNEMLTGHHHSPAIVSTSTPFTNSPNGIQGGLAEYSPSSVALPFSSHDRAFYIKDEPSVSGNYPSTPTSTWTSPGINTSGLSGSDVEASSSSASGYSPHSPSTQIPWQQRQPIPNRPRGQSVGSSDGHRGQDSSRGRTHHRIGSSPIPSRRHSPYLHAHSLSLMVPDKDHLAVPGHGFESNGNPVQRRHSFTGNRHESNFLSPSSPMSPSGSDNGLEGAFVATEPRIRRVASTAGIKASQARRTKEAKFCCDICGQTFTTNHNFKNHMNVHLGIKDYHCDRCGRESTTQSVHARHVKTCKAVKLEPGSSMAYPHP